MYHTCFGVNTLVLSGYHTLSEGLHFITHLQWPKDEQKRVFEKQHALSHPGNLPANPHHEGAKKVAG